jgi:hypothetical protein
MSYFGKPTETVDERQTEAFVPVDVDEQVDAVDPVAAEAPAVGPVASTGPAVGPAAATGPAVGPVAATGPAVGPVAATGPAVGPVAATGPAVEPLARWEQVAGADPIEPVYAGEADELDTRYDEQPRSVGSRLADFRDRVVRGLQGVDRGAADRPALEPGTPVAADVGQHDVLAEVPSRSEDTRFPIGPMGYNRTAVNERIGVLEHEITTLGQELEELRRSKSTASITDEIERLGEQTASILVVAHDQASETTRQAQERAERCIADATLNANALTAEARRRLDEIDNETDAVWQERARLLDDARNVGLALIALAEEAVERFPPEDKPTEVPQVTD